MTSPNNAPNNQSGAPGDKQNAIFDSDPFGDIKKEENDPAPSPGFVNVFHTNSDIDTDQSSQHHTLGVQHNQASPGDHVHDGTTSNKVGQGLAMSVSGDTNGNAALQDLIRMLQRVIDFTDSTV